MAAAEQTFVHLRVRTAYSLTEGAIRPRTLAAACRAAGMPAAGVTDTNNLFGVYDWAKVLREAGVQPVVGCTVLVDTGLDEPRRRLNAFWRPPGIALLVQDETGYRNLSRILSRAYLASGDGEAVRAPLSLIEEFSGGLIALSGGPDGPLDRLIREGQGGPAASLCERLAGAFPGRFYIELQRLGLAGEAEVEGALLDLAYGRDLPIVATNDAHFLAEEEFEACDALLCIGQGTVIGEPDRRRVTPEHRLKSPAEMAALFADLPEARLATIEIARRCAYAPEARDPILPRFTPRSGLSTAEELRAQARGGLDRLLSEHGLFAPREVYDQRLDYELGIILEKGFDGYFLIVSDFMKWARARGIPVGVRGSGATSIVAWALEITALDPIRFGLVFERFLNPERRSMPDFDIDFCQERREEVIRYVQETYGADRVAQIIALGSLQARAAVRDVGRVLQLPYGLVDRIAKMIPAPAGGKAEPLAKIVAAEPRLGEIMESEPQTKPLFEIAQRLEGLYRNAATHAAGLVIVDRPLEELVPLYRDPRADMPVTQFDFKKGEEAGLVKFDFLGLKTLTTIALAERMLAARGITVKAEALPFDDAGTFEMLSRGDAAGVFQLESAGMRDLLRKLRPDRIEDVIALVALYRPGPMDSIPRYIACKHGHEKPHYLHPALEPILRETFGVMTYQEDVMRIARELAGYTFGEADNLRRAMGKKKPEEMARERVKFLDGATARGIAKDVAEEIFEQAAKFAGYGFNKGHAAAYAHVAYQTAWLKANHPVEFLAASMTLDMGSPERLAMFRQEARRLGIAVLPPDINRSGALFTCDYSGEKPAIRYALAAIRNVGRAAMEHVEALRGEAGDFASIWDFARRADPRHVNKRTFENLAMAGAFDTLEPDRARVFAAADLLVAASGSSARERQDGQSSLFGGGAVAAADPALPSVPPWSPEDRLQREFDALGSYISGHPLDDWATTLRRARAQPFAEVLADPRRGVREVRLAGSVVRRQERRSRKNTVFAFVTFSDSSGLFEAMVFAETLNRRRALLEPGAKVLIEATVEWQEDDLKLRLRDVRPLEDVAAESDEGARIVLAQTADLSETLDRLRGRLPEAGRGGIALVLLLGDDREVELELPGRFRVTPQVVNAFKDLPGVAQVERL